LLVYTEMIIGEIQGMKKKLDRYLLIISFEKYGMTTNENTDRKNIIGKL